MSALSADAALAPDAAQEARATAGRAYLRGAVGLLEHAAVLLAPATETQREAVPELAGRLDDALAALRRGELPTAASEAPAAPEPEPWPKAAKSGSRGGGLW